MTEPVPEQKPKSDEKLLQALYEYTEALHKEQVELRDSLKTAVKTVKKMKQKFKKANAKPITQQPKAHVLAPKKVVAPPESTPKHVDFFNY